MMVCDVLPNRNMVKATGTVTKLITENLPKIETVYSRIRKGKSTLFTHPALRQPLPLAQVSRAGQGHGPQHSTTRRLHTEQVKRT